MVLIGGDLVDSSAMNINDLLALKPYRCLFILYLVIMNIICQIQIASYRNYLLLMFSGLTTKLLLSTPLAIGINDNLSLKEKCCYIDRLSMQSV